MSEQNFYRCSPRKIREFTTDALGAGLVPMITSSPGMGKSSIMHSIAESFNLELIDIRLSTCSPEDMSGLPDFYTDEYGQRRARFVPFEMFPLLKNELPNGRDGWMIFYDEMNSGTKMVQAASYKVILDRMIGQSKLHDRVVQAGAGNLITDRAIVENMSTAMQSRLIHLEMELSVPEWLEDVAYKQKYDERIVAFINFDNGKLMDFKPDHQEKTFCCPRTWEFMNRLIKNPDGTTNPVTVDKTPLYAGTVTSGVAAQFVAFCALQKELLTIKDVLRSPSTAEIPRDAERRWLIVSHLVGKTDEKNFSDVATYINRMDLAFKILFFRAIQVQHPKLRTDPTFMQGLSEISKHVNRK